MGDERAQALAYPRAPLLALSAKAQVARKLREPLSTAYSPTQRHIHRPNPALSKTQYTHTQLYDARSATLTQTDTLTQRRFNEPSCVRARREEAQ